MKSLLWLVLFAAVVANVFVSVASVGGVTQLMSSIVSGTVVLCAGVGLWLLREPRTGGRSG